MGLGLSRAATFTSRALREIGAAREAEKRMEEQKRLAAEQQRIADERWQQQFRLNLAEGGWTPRADAMVTPTAPQPALFSSGGPGLAGIGEFVGAAPPEAPAPFLPERFDQSLDLGGLGSFVRPSRETLAREAQTDAERKADAARTRQVGAITDFLANANPTPEQRAAALVEGVPGSQVFPQERAPRQPSPLQSIKGEDGRLYTFDPNTGRYADAGIGGGGKPTIGPAPGEARTRILMGLPRAEQALSEIERFLQVDPESGQPGRSVPAESFLGRATPGRFLQSEDVQSYQAAADRLASAILRVESGAAITEEEARRYAQQFIPRPEDKPETVRQKLEVLRSTIERMRALGGVGGGFDLDANADLTNLSPNNPMRRFLR